MIEERRLQRRPDLQPAAARAGQQVRVGVPAQHIGGEPPAEQRPDLLGRGPEGLARADTALLQRAATALLAGQGEGPTDAILRALGLDDLSLRQGNGDTRDTIITLGKQLSRRWYVGYERGVNATAGTFQLVYRIAQRFTLRAQSGLENSLDLIWVWRFDEPLTPRRDGP